MGCGGWRGMCVSRTTVGVLLLWARRIVTQVWERTLGLPFGFGQRGSTCQQATWCLSLAGEFARATGQAAASSLIDLKKAYERSVHPYLWRMGTKHLFNLRLLRFLIALYGGPRVAMVNGAATDAAPAIMAADVAGCAHAAALMKLTLVDSLDFVVARWTSVKTHSFRW